jgi:hypothetical protein
MPGIRRLCCVRAVHLDATLRRGWRGASPVQAIELIDKLKRSLQLPDARLEDLPPRDLDKLKEILGAVQKFADERIKKRP